MKSPLDRLPALALAVAMTLGVVACARDKGQSDPGDGEAKAAATPSFNLRPAASAYSKVLPAMYRERCIEKDGQEDECRFLRSLLVVEVTMALDEIQRSRDQRGAAQALAALALDDDPGVIVAAARVLGSFPATPGIAEKALPMLLESPWLTVQQAAAQLLTAQPDQSLAAIGTQWTDNHRTLSPQSSYEQYPDFPAHYAAMQFPDYPNAEWFSPADSDRSIGWWTTDDVNAVVSWLAARLKTQPLDFQQWAQRLTAQSTAAMQSIDPGKQARLQKLIEEFARTQNTALLQEMQKLQEEMTAPIAAAGEVSEKGVDRIVPLASGGAMERARYFVAEEKAGHVARLILVYPLAERGRTVIQEAWNLGDYPGAWPAAARQ
ncbi:MAG: hypothetical protein IT480_13570 [Gammaproteobacteria bacterium]|nr:hypothetical protein [Gammaproteobacteria bacterium]